MCHSARLSAFLREAIDDENGWISFARYMELALYAPGLGYYAAGAAKFGAAGDFVTAPELTPLFARTLARSVAAVLRESAGEVLELGAGSGRLAVDVLLELERLEALPDRYAILEVSPDLQARQRALIAAEVGHLAERVVWLDALPETITGVVLANEVLDALPVHLVHWADAGVMERGVGWDEGQGFVWVDRPMAKTSPLAGRVPACMPEPLDGLGACSSNSPSRPQPSPHVGREYVGPSPTPVGEAGRGSFSLPPHILALPIQAPYLSEVCLAAPALIASLAERLQRGAMIFLDYGFPQAEYYHPQRHMGTLRAHYRQHALDDPFYLPGLCDLTAHVDFSSVAAAGVSAGLNLLGYTSQANFLLDAGLIDLMRDLDPTRPDYLRVASAVQKLLQPQEMGELFKVIALGRGLEAAPPGFGRGDRSGAL